MDRTRTRTGTILVFNLLVQFLGLVSSRCHKPGNRTRIPAIFTFGDSFLDPGNNNFFPTPLKANHAPYGQSFPGRIPTGRFSDGRLFADFLASALRIKDAIPPFADPSLSPQELRTGVSFAAGGSGYDHLTTLVANVPTVSKQVFNFRDYVVKLNKDVGQVAAKNIIEASFAIVVAGTNDLLVNMYQTPTRQIHYGLSGYQDFLLQKIVDSIQNLYGHGLRKFLVAGLPPIGCLPIEVTTKLGLNQCIRDENLDSQSYNQKLISLLNEIQAKLTWSKIVYADIYTPISDIVSNPIKHGFEVTNRGCCGTGLIEVAFLCKQFSPVCPNPNQYLFWDAANPSEAAHKILAQFLLEHAVPLLYPKRLSLRALSSSVS